MLHRGRDVVPPTAEPYKHALGGGGVGAGGKGGAHPVALQARGEGFDAGREGAGGLEGVVGGGAGGHKVLQNGGLKQVADW